MECVSQRNAPSFVGITKNGICLELSNLFCTFAVSINIIYIKDEKTANSFRGTDMYGDDFKGCCRNIFINQRARIRIVRYLGDEERFGREMNVIKDVSFEGRILEMTQKAIAFVDTQIREYTFLGEDARFVTIPQYPPFCWTELIVNAVAHRDYSILGTDIMVKIFDHHYIVESPGILPGLVRIDNIRQMHFSCLWRIYPQSADMKTISKTK